MNVLMVTTSYPLNDKSLSGIFVKHLKNALTQLCSVDVICPDDAKTIVVDKDIFRSVYTFKKWQVLAHGSGGIPVQIKKNNLLIVLVPFLLFSLFCSVVKRAKKYDVIHANWAVSGAICAPVKWLLNKPLITTLRGEDIKQELNFPGNIFLNMTLKYSDVVISVSHDMHQLLISRFPKYRRKFHVINNGVGSMFSNEKEAVVKNPYDGSICNISSVGSLIPRKNIEFTLRCLSEAKKRGLNFSYRIVGEGQCKKALVELCSELGISEDVFFLGELPFAEVAEVLSTSTFLISSSLHEGRPNSVVEGMAAGCCVILSDIDGHRELVDMAGCGVLFSNKSQNSLVDCLLGLTDCKKQILEMGLSARRFIIEQNLTWEACARRYLDVYEQLTSV